MNKKPLAIRLGNKLRKLRGTTPQIRFARELGISKTSLNRIEIGEQNVSLKTLDILCQQLKCDVGDLFEK